MRKVRWVVSYEFCRKFHTLYIKTLYNFWQSACQNLVGNLTCEFGRLTGIVAVKGDYYFIRDDHRVVPNTRGCPTFYHGY